MKRKRTIGIMLVLAILIASYPRVLVHAQISDKELKKKYIAAIKKNLTETGDSFVFGELYDYNGDGILECRTELWCNGSYTQPDMLYAYDVKQDKVFKLFDEEFFLLFNHEHCVSCKTRDWDGAEILDQEYTMFDIVDAKVKVLDTYKVYYGDYTRNGKTISQEEYQNFVDTCEQTNLDAYEFEISDDSYYTPEQLGISLYQSIGISIESIDNDKICYRTVHRRRIGSQLEGPLQTAELTNQTEFYRYWRGSVWYYAYEIAANENTKDRVYKIDYSEFSNWAWDNIGNSNNRIVVKDGKVEKLIVDVEFY